MKQCNGRKSHRKKLLRVVLADDSEPVRQMLARLLSSLPQFQIVGEADNGCEALELITRQLPDLVILDIHMPGLSGLEVLKGLQKQGLAGRVLVFSQMNEEPYRRKCLQLGARGFFAKVTGFDRFQRTLEKMSPRQKEQKASL